MKSRVVIFATKACLAIFAFVLAAMLYVMFPYQDRHQSFEVAVAALASGELKRVAEILEELRRDPKHAPHVHYLQGRLHLRAGEIEESLSELQLSLYHPDTEIAAHIATGQALYQLGRGKDASEHWTYVLSLDKNAADAHRWLGAFYYDIGAANSAIYHLKQVAELDASDPRPHRLLGLINRDFDHFDAAVDCYRESISRSTDQPDYQQLLHELAECEIRLNRHAEAAEVLTECNESSVRNTLLAECQLVNGSPREALALLDRAIELSPDNLEALTLKSRLLMQEGTVDSAIEVLESAVRIGPKEFEAHLSLAQAYQRIGRIDDAEKMRAVGEELRGLWKAYSDLHIEAMEHPGDAQLRFVIGEMALELQLPDLAMEWFRAALALDGKHEGARHQLQALARRGQS